MPSIKRKRRIGQVGWTDAHRRQLIDGYDWFGGAWGDPVTHYRELPPEIRPPWPSPEMEADMRAAWEFFRDEILAEYRDETTRPWAWWRFDAPKGYRINTAEYMPHDFEPALLDELGLLTPAALEKARNCPHLTRGVGNECYEPIFRRRWGWWRFLSPARRDHDELEAVQLCELDERHGGVLTAREQYVLEHHADNQTYATMNKASLPRAEVAALGLPDWFIDPIDDPPQPEKRKR